MPLLPPPLRPHTTPPQTNDVGVAKDGSLKDSHVPGMALTARATLFAEGCRGSLSQHVMKRFGLREQAGAQPQTYALGVKEVWEVSGQPGRLRHVVRCASSASCWATCHLLAGWHHRCRLVCLHF
jgi:flavin-dependent dehydrogenase